MIRYNRILFFSPSVLSSFVLSSNQTNTKIEFFFSPSAQSFFFPLKSRFYFLNQVYGEAYTCPCIRLHPIDPCFVAQSNGNYIAIFSSSAPFRLDKYRRYEGHGVSGFPIKCNFSLDGQTLATGSNEGSIYFYNYKTAQLVRKIKAYPSACIDVAFHPTMSNVVASCSWSGDVSVVE